MSLLCRYCVVTVSWLCSGEEPRLPNHTQPENWLQMQKLCLECVGSVSGVCLDCVWTVSGVCLECVWSVSFGSFFLHQEKPPASWSGVCREGVGKGRCCIVSPSLSVMWLLQCHALLHPQFPRFQLHAFREALVAGLQGTCLHTRIHRPSLDIRALHTGSHREEKASTASCKTVLTEDISEARFRGCMITLCDLSMHARYKACNEGFPSFFLL